MQEKFYLKKDMFHCWWLGFLTGGVITFLVCVVMGAAAAYYGL